MISKDTVETFTETMINHQARVGLRTHTWTTTEDRHRRAYVESVAKSFEAIGVKVEGRGETEEKR